MNVGSEPPSNEQWKIIVTFTSSTPEFRWFKGQVLGLGLKPWPTMVVSRSSWKYPHRAQRMVFVNGKILRDDWGYPHFRKPPYLLIWLYSPFSNTCESFVSIFVRFVLFLASTSIPDTSNSRVQSPGLSNFSRFQTQSQCGDFHKWGTPKMVGL